jgi:hypothetical protein
MKRPNVPTGAVTLLIALAAAGPAPGAGPEAPTVRLLVPAYFYPSGDGLKAWERLLDAADRAPVVAVVNPDSGPGKRADNNYVALFRRARRSKATLLGYVTLSYAKRPVSAVKADIDSWLFFYPDVGGIFFDEQPSQPEHAAFAAECFAHARGRIKGALLVSNPGTACSREYLAGADGPVACLFENEKGFGDYRSPDWAGRYGAERFAVLLYRVPAAGPMREALREAVRKRAGYVYVTDAPAPMPWGRLPSYWDDEVAAAAQENRRQER